jgi:hypothetical protein
MKVTREHLQEYLSNKSRAYQLGWMACESGHYPEEFEDDWVKTEFDYGYGDCYANNQSEPTDFLDEPVEYKP